MPLEFFPSLNACFNACSAVFLTLGYVFIRNKNVAGHRACMIGALAASTLFLAGYIYYHFHEGTTPFLHQGLLRRVYFTILISHMILAVTIVPLVLITVIRAAKGQFERHAKIARWTWPLWMYVSVTGVLVYFFLHGL